MSETTLFEKIMLVALALFLLANWIWDISSNAIFGYLTNGFWEVPALQSMHLSWYIVIGLGCFFWYMAIETGRDNFELRKMLEKEGVENGSE